MPQKPKEINISKPKAIMSLHMLMDSGQGGYQRPRTAEAMEARVGLRMAWKVLSKEMARSGNPHPKLGRTSQHNGARSKRSGRGWFWPFPLTTRKITLVGCARPPLCYKCVSVMNRHSWAPRLICQRTPPSYSPHPAVCITVQKLRYEI